MPFPLIADRDAVISKLYGMVNLIEFMSKV